MTANDIKHILEAINKAPDKLSRRQRDQVKTLEHFAPDLNYDQLKLMFHLLIIAGYYMPVCPACGKPIKNVSEFSIDHIHPRSKNGSNHLTNLQPMHKSCNEAKAAKIQIQYTVKYSINTQIQVEITARCENNKCRKYKNKPLQITAKHNGR